MTEEQANQIANVILGCLHREYPNKTTHVLNDDRDARPPRELTPAFFGCFDWHSAVHSHWALLRLLRWVPDADCVPRVRRALAESFSEKRLAAELEFQQRDNRRSYEMPYGAAWLLQLAAELHELAAEPGPLAAEASVWRDRLADLEELFAERVRDWIAGLRYAIRSGEHSQSAFALGLVYDWAQVVGNDGMASRISLRTRELYGADRNAPLAFEPSAYDFLSPSLGEADLLGRILTASEFNKWTEGFFGELPRPDWLEPVACLDPSDGKLAHFQGLNLSRAWMMTRIAAALPSADPRAAVLRQSAAAHREAGLTATLGDHYETAHWLGSFTVYLLTLP